MRGMLPVTQRGRNGAIYSIHAPGVSALVAPAFALAGWPGAAAIMSLLAAFAAMLVWLIVVDVLDLLS